MKDVDNINVLKASAFDFLLPEGLIAKKPAEKRDSSRLLVLCRKGPIEHRSFNNLHEYFNKDDLLLLNNTKVFPARLTGIKPTGGRFEFLLVKEIGPGRWEILSRGKYNGKISIAEGFSAEIENGVARFFYSGNFMENLWRYGEMPLPPYIKRKPEANDKEWYQTVYAEKEGSIAAPTAGMHFTEELIGEIKDKGVNIRYLTLHVGIGTFKPIKTENLREHSMDQEYFEISKDVIEEIKKTKASGKRVITVGTTTTRALEGYMSGRYSPIHPFTLLGESPEATHSPIHRICGYTDIFIYPGYKFKVADALITNFHLPRSTPLMLTSAFCGAEKLSRAYRVAISQKYRFFSYGDAMLIL